MNNKDLLNNKPDETDMQQAAAANVIRDKLSKIYNKEPDAVEELKDSNLITPEKKSISKHHGYLDELSKSGLSLAEIQQAWHDYYQKLSDKEKHEVWNEFYSMHDKRKQKAKEDAFAREAVKNESEKTETNSQPKEEAFRPQPVTIPPPKIKQSKARKKSPSPKLNAVKNDLLNRVEKRARKSNKRSHFHSLAFGLSFGTLVIFILLFSFFNERFITPFIRPSQNVSATSIIVDPNQSGNVGKDPKIIIPKINIEAPVVYNIPIEAINDEKIIQNALNNGVVHYPTTPNPGENGNSVIVGHSSSNILNSGRYKFAFLLLKSLDKGDTFFVNKDGKRYVYKVYNKFVTSPKDTSVLDAPKDRKAIMTLITCDPPGLSVNRLIIQAEQIFPAVSKNKESSVDQTSEPVPEVLPSNSESLWHRLTHSLF